MFGSVGRSEGVGRGRPADTWGGGLRGGAGGGSLTGAATGGRGLSRGGVGPGVDVGGGAVVALGVGLAQLLVVLLQGRGP